MTSSGNLFKDIYLPIKTENDTDNFEDLGFLKEIIGEANVAALGDLTHGIGNIFKLNHRILAFLVKTLDFDVFSIEGDMTAAYHLNEYIMTGKGNPKELMAAFHMFIWENQEFFATIEWMRNYNKNAAKKIQLSGFHTDHLSAAEEVKKLISNTEIYTKVDLIAEEIQKISKDFYSQNYNVADEEKMREVYEKIEKSAQYQMIVNEIDFIRKYINTPEREEKSDAKTFLWLNQNLRLIEQRAQMLIKNLVSVRDATMAENFLWTQKQNPNSKFVIMGHNAHIQKVSFPGDPIVWMGQILAATLKNNYRAIGYIVYGGTYTTTRDKEGAFVKSELFTPPSNSLEAHLKQFNEPIVFINLNHEKLSTIFPSSAMARMGVGGGGEYKESFGYYNFKDAYDGIIYLEKSVATNALKEAAPLPFFKKVGNNNNPPPESSPNESLTP